MSVTPIESSLAMPAADMSIEPITTGTDAADTTNGSGFGQMLADSVDNLTKVQATADDLAVQAATGKLQDVHDYTIAAEQAALTTELVVTMRNKAVEAFSEIMRMPL